MDQLIYTEVSSKDVADIVEKMVSSVENEYDRVPIMMGSIALAVVLQVPNIDPDKLIEIVKGVSEYIALAVMDVSNGIQTN